MEKAVLFQSPPWLPGTWGSSPARPFLDGPRPWGQPSLDHSQSYQVPMRWGPQTQGVGSVWPEWWPLPSPLTLRTDWLAGSAGVEWGRQRPPRPVGKTVQSHHLWLRIPARRPRRSKAGKVLIKPSEGIIFRLTPRALDPGVPHVGRGPTAGPGLAGLCGLCDPDPDQLPTAQAGQPGLRDTVRPLPGSRGPFPLSPSV